MYRNILIPVAFDAENKPERSLAVAAALAAPGAKVTVMHVMEEPPAYAVSYMPPGFLEDLEVAVRGELQGYADRFADGAAVVLKGHAGRAILDWAEANGTDCIVIASHRPGIQDYVLGSTAARVVRHAQCSVHVLR